LPRHG